MTLRPLSIALLVALVACDRGGKETSWFGGASDGAIATSAADAQLDAAGRLNFEVTSDVYRRWTVAQRALGNSPVARAIAQLGRRALTQKELAAGVARVENDATARAAVSNAGMSPLEYVYATVALEQAMAVARGRLAPRRSGVPAQNVELARRHEREITSGMIGDTTMVGMPVPSPYDSASPPLPPASTLPPPRPPAAAPLPPRDTVAPTPRDTTSPAPARPAPVPTPPPPPVDTTGTP